MDNRIFITDDNGKEIELNILFTFDNNDKNYAVCYEGSNEDELVAFVYDENGNMYAVDDPEELAMIEEVVNAFDEDNVNEK